MNATSVTSQCRTAPSYVCVSAILFAAVVITSTAHGSVFAASPPAVYVDFPNGAFYRTCSTYTEGAVPSLHIKKHVVHTCEGPSPLKVRPTTISLSVDGDGYLSNLDWSTWSARAAAGSGLQEVRCFGGSTDPHCSGGQFGYTVPVDVRLSTPVATSRGIAFTVLMVVRNGRSMRTCLPPASAC